MPFLKEEKSEHERARTCELTRQQFCARHCELPLSKMGSKGLFPGRVSEANQGRGQPRRGYRRPKPATHSGAGRKSCRAACFLWYFLSLRKKVLPPSGRQPHRPRRSRRVKPPTEKWAAHAGAPKGFPLALWKPSGTEVDEKPMGCQIPLSHRQGTDFGKVAVSCRLQGAFRSPPAPLWAAAADISHSNL